ncbi:MAG TPA: NADH:ubiquinone oxidoreductase subunit N, partial [Chromatiales bacterium]|nr:NADH:ubiquinone oxidoreductase subunit N [Chromatiales bacterium]
MPSTLTDLAPMLPEIWLAAMACVVLVADVYAGRGRITVAYLLAQLSLLGALWLLLRDRSAVPVSLFDGAFLRDELADLLKLFVLGLTVAAFAYARGYLQGRGLERGEYFALGLFGVLGMMVLISAGSLLTLYLGLELLALSLYAMVALHRDS